MAIKPDKGVYRLFFAAPAFTAAACLALAVVPPSPAQAIDYTDKDAQSFDYIPPDSQPGPALAQPVITSEYQDAEIIDDPLYGIVVVSKYRWKNWVFRAVYLFLIYSALIIVIVSLPKNSEYNIIVSYVLSGASFTLAFWEFLCAILLLRLGSASWLYIAPVSLIMAGIFYLVLLKIKKFDLALSELKESFQHMNAVTKEDPRLVSVDGSPGDWPENDFLK